MNINYEKSVKILGVKIKYNTKKGYYKRKYILKLFVFVFSILSKILSYKYNEIVSLGYNYETQFRIDDLKAALHLKNNNYLFSWVYVNDRSIMLSLLSDLDIVRTPDFTVLRFGMYKDKNTQLAFHPRFENEQFDENGNVKEDIFKECSQELISRINHLADKTEELFKSDNKTMFVIKVKKTNTEYDKNYIENIYKILSAKYVTQKFKLLAFIQNCDFNAQEQKFLRELENSKLKIINIKSFAHDASTDTDGDTYGWLTNLYKELVCY